MKNTYYYINEKMNPNDLVLVIAFFAIATGIICAQLFIKDSTGGYLDLIVSMVGVGFSIPFIAHFMDKSVKFLDFKLKKNKIVRNGRLIRGKVVESIKGKILLKESISGNSLYSYYPVVEAYIDGEERRITSKFPVSNSHLTGLSNRNVSVMLYKEDFILIDICAAKDFSTSIEYIDTHGKTFYNAVRKAENMYVIMVGAGIALIMAAGLIIKLLLRYVFFVNFYLQFAKYKIYGGVRIYFLRIEHFLYNRLTPIGSISPTAA